LLLKQAPAAPDIVGTSYDETINGSRSSLTNCSVPFKRIVGEQARNGPQTALHNRNSRAS
jgi:hypothetical protein